MKLLSFNPFRTIGIPNVKYIKPDLMFREMDAIKEADVLLFPETWQVNTLVYGLNKKIFPNIQTIQIGQNKIEQTRALWAVCPEHTPYTEILGNTKENIEKVLETFPMPFVAKESRNSMGKGVFLIENENQFLDYAARNDVFYIQEYLPNDGRDLRVVVVGKEIVTAYWRIGADGAFLHNVAKGGDISFTDIPLEALNIIQNVANALNVNHAGFDLIYSEGQYYILEFNVLFGNQGLLEAGIKIEQKIYNYLLSEFTPTFPTTPITPTPSRRKQIS
ncbi:hypothetical protein LC040_04710 [Bacillus tianshenii]|nr:hypothetical protein LC040_04710 [Bacillus tianshenii]